MVQAELKNQRAEVYIPDGSAPVQAFQRTTHLAIAAHQDDIEIMSYEAIAHCFHNRDSWFTGVVVTDGSGSPRTNLYEQYTDAQMAEVRKLEQKKAACIGEYSALAMLNYASAELKKTGNRDVIDDLKSLIRLARPEIIYTHNPADKHDTHVAVVLRVIEALRSMEDESMPRKLYGCEVWRSLDWLADQDKVKLDAGMYPNLAAALLGVYDSQIGGGKRYDKATEGRRIANATFSESHSTDAYQAVIFGMDLTPLIENPDLSVTQLVKNHLDRFAEDVSGRLDRLSR